MRARLAGSTQGCLLDAIWAGDRFVATGAGARLVTSADGAPWADAPVDATMGDVTMRLLVRLGDSIVAFGSTESEDGSTAGIWRRDLP